MVRNFALTKLNCQGGNEHLTAIDIINCPQLTSIERNARTSFHTGQIEKLETKIIELEKRQKQAQSQVKRLVDLIKTGSNFN